MYRLYGSAQDRLKDSLFWRFGRTYGREFWALRDVSFELRRGETFGVIGRNGSGKSTLLQLLSGVLQPTIGELVVGGRLAALLELGSGFNPEFTGRENVFLNAAILGVPRAEVEARFEQIAAFADIGDFIDQPVKLYSSGMFVRLAFAVSTSIDADLLVIDEALAVGDVFFRQKCYQRLEQLREQGVAIVLVSHAMGDVEQFCDRALLLVHGEPVFLGPATDAVKAYYLEQARSYRASELPGDAEAHRQMQHRSSSAFAWPARDLLTDVSSQPQVTQGAARCTAVAVCDEHGHLRYAFEQGEVAAFLYEFELLEDIEVPVAGVVLRTDKAVVVHGKSTMEYGTEVPKRVPAGTRLRFKQDIQLGLALGEYTFEVGLVSLPMTIYQLRASMTYEELSEHYHWLCSLPAAGSFAVLARRLGSPVQLLHHGLADLPGGCNVLVDVQPG
jgi:ABC-type polysaccharide/polyol phosphate transport system ATPase subunit